MLCGTVGHPTEIVTCKGDQRHGMHLTWLCPLSTSTAVLYNTTAYWISFDIVQSSYRRSVNGPNALWRQISYAPFQD